MNRKSTKPVSHLNKGESFVSPSGLIWKVEDVRSIGRGKTQVFGIRDNGVQRNKLSFTFLSQQEVEMA
jgi:hypothetical protein